MTAPVPDPTGKRGALSASRVALGLALAAALAVGVLKSPSSGPTPPPPPPADTTHVDSTPAVPIVPPPDTSGGIDTLAAVHQWQCPTSAPEAIVIDLRDLTTVKVTGDVLAYRPVSFHATSAPVVLCGPATMVRQMLRHPETGHGVPAILAPPNSLATSYVVPSLTIVGGHVVAPSDTIALARVGLTRLVATALNAQTAGAVDTTRLWTRFAVVPAADSAHTYLLAQGTTWYYVPTLGTRPRTMIEENRGGDWPPFGTRTPTTWLATYAPPVPVSRVLRVYAVRVDAATTAVATVQSYDGSW